MARVLITGASGFIGHYLATALARQGDEVTCLVRKTSQVAQLGEVSKIIGDVTDEPSMVTAVAGQEVVYHLAGCIKALHADQMHRVNAEGTRNVVQACSAQPNPPVLVYVSSLAAAGPSTADRPRVETDPLVQVSTYGRSKREGELAVQGFADRVPITVVRPPTVLGEGDRTTLGWFRSIARSGVHLVPGFATRRYSLIHAADLTQGIILAAQRGKRVLPLDRNGVPTQSQGFYFLAGDENPTYPDLGRMIGEALGRRRVLALPVGSGLVWTVAGFAELAARLRRDPLIFNFDKVREVRAGSWTCLPKKAKEELGFSVGAPLAERLRQTAQWYRQEGWL